MRIYMFKSETNTELFAFAGEASGSKLPDQFRPWHTTGIIYDGKAPPHGLPRAPIERAINERGFQLWRMKVKTETETATEKAASA
jgi:hypothetical protein